MFTGVSVRARARVRTRAILALWTPSLVELQDGGRAHNLKCAVRDGGMAKGGVRLDIGT